MDGYDIIFDTVAKRTFEECEGFLTPMAFISGRFPVRCDRRGGRKAKGVPGGPTAEDMKWMKKQVEAGKIGIDKVFSHDHAKESLAYSKAEKARGNIVLKAA